jgi:hypothetical protein
MILFEPVLGPVCQEGGPYEGYNRFRQEAKEANWVLRLFEALASPKGPNYAELIKERFEMIGLEVSASAHEMTPDEAKRWALHTVWNTVQYKVQDCFPRLMPTEEGFVQGWGFHTLLAAIYLQARTLEGPALQGTRSSLRSPRL